jgi:hypothetical protein
LVTITSAVVAIMTESFVMTPSVTFYSNQPVLLLSLLRKSSPLSSQDPRADLQTSTFLIGSIPNLLPWMFLLYLLYRNSLSSAPPPYKDMLCVLVRKGNALHMSSHVMM